MSFSLVLVPNCSWFDRLKKSSRCSWRFFFAGFDPGYSDKDLKATIGRISKAKAAFAENRAKFEKFELGAKEKEILETLVSRWDTLVKTEEGIEPLQLSADPADHLKALEIQKGVFDKQYHDVFDSFTDIIAQEKELADVSVESARASAARSIQSSMIGALVGSVLALLFGLVFSLSLAKTFSRISNELFGGADVVNHTSEQLSDLSKKVASENRTQAAALQETAATIEQINAMIIKNSENAKESREVAAESQAVVSRGQNAVELTVNSIHRLTESNRDLNDRVAANNKDLDKIFRVIEDIASKTAVINEIVFQTKLLSFNASVEAARAGEQGKGFSVVAEEVGSLAQLSGTAAKDISTLLQSSINIVKTTIRNTTEGFQKNLANTQSAIDEAVGNANKCRQTLDEIVRQSAEVDRRIEEIASATSEQSRGVQEITKAISLLEKGTHQSLATSEDSAGCADRLADESKRLYRTVNALLEVTRGESNRESQAADVRAQLSPAQHAETGSESQAA